jgi:4-hydroxy-tetrahydrodipicolinate synthase
LQAMEKLAAIRICGIKDSSGDWRHVRELLAVRSPAFAIGQGDETQLARSLEHGADAIVPGIANLMPEVCVELANACRAGERGRASAAQAAIDSARRMYQGVYWLTALKAALSLEGICQPYCLEPVPTADAAVLEVTREALVV